MKLFLVTILTLGSFFCFAQPSLSVYAFTKGVAPIPAFAVPDPAAMVFFKGNLFEKIEIAPDVAYNLGNGELWFTDFWVRWNQALDPHCKWRLTFGGTYSFVSKEYGLNGGHISQSVKYLVGQAKLRYAFNETNRVYVDYWYNYALNSEHGIRGSYYSLVYAREQEIEHHWELSSKANTFFVDFDDGTHGLAFALEGDFKHKESGLFAGVHLLQPLSLQSHEEVKFEYAFFAGITRKIL